MTFAIDEINNSTSLLPGIRLGYEVHDDCFETVASILPSLLFLSNSKGSGVDVLCNYTEYRSRAIALLGPWTSEQAIIIAKLFGLFLFPQVSPLRSSICYGWSQSKQRYGSSSAKLSNKKVFPSFLRTMPSDNNQAIAIVSIIRKFKWNWIAGIGSDDEYGRQGIELVQRYASLQGICVGFIEIIPIHLSLSSTKQKISEIIDHISQVNVNIIILFSSEGPVQELMKEVIQRNITRKVWIASEAWVKSGVVINIPGIERIGTVIGTVINSGSMPGFEDYILNHLTNIRSSKRQRCDAEYCGNHIFPFWPYPTSQQLLSDVQLLSPENLSVVLDQPVRRDTFSVYTAVYSIAYALHTLLKCHTGGCETATVWYNWQVQKSFNVYTQSQKLHADLIYVSGLCLLEVLKQVKFTVNGIGVSFDAEGNPQQGYDIITWTQHAGQLQLPVIGSYKDHLTIDASLIQWKTDNNEVPLSHCSKSCGLGQKKLVISLYSCCFECEDCPSGTFQNSTDGFSCYLCQPDEWSLPKSSSCFKRTLQYLSVSSPLGVTLLLFMVLELTLILAVIVIFLVNSGAPIVEGTGGKMNIVILTSLALLCCSSLLFLGEPTELTCKLRQPVTTLSLTICTSILLINSVQILLTIEFTSLSKPFLCKYQCCGRYAILCASLGGQGAICYLWLKTHGDFLMMTTGDSEGALSLFCKSDSELVFWLMLGYSGLLALACFMSTFLIQTPAQTYNLAREITVSMLFFISVWICFIPTYTAVKKRYTPAVQITAMLLSSMAILGAYFIPKCFVLWFKPQYNTRDYFQVYNLKISGKKEHQ
ncbi:taste receptor type 1 member 3-like [Hypanus sabinus]|uniref:taste receptor type 1 member 3-like n=1 Tax=Hypanus sabinus TaxID=79690 RepID=UPI0028C396E8|nr:taste receptor type 1 member 3-like [Hypanus sabinus]